MRCEYCKYFGCLDAEPKPFKLSRIPSELLRDLSPLIIGALWGAIGAPVNGSGSGMMTFKLLNGFDGDLVLFLLASRAFSVP